MREVEDRLWLGGPPLDRTGRNREQVTAGGLAEALARFNDTMLGVGTTRQVECVDLARKLPKESDNFCDDVHDTDEGSHWATEIVAGHLLEAPPFRR